MSTITNPAFDSKDPSEVVTLGFDFTALTDAPAAPTVTITRHSGSADAAPQQMLSGSPVLSGGKVLQRVISGVAGANYLLRCQVDAPDGSRYVLAGVLPVRSA